MDYCWTVSKVRGMIELSVTERSFHHSSTITYCTFHDSVLSLRPSHLSPPFLLLDWWDNVCNINGSLKTSTAGFWSGRERPPPTTTFFLLSPLCCCWGADKCCMEFAGQILLLILWSIQLLSIWLVWKCSILVTSLSLSLYSLKNAAEVSTGGHWHGSRPS